MGSTRKDPTRRSPGALAYAGIIGVVTAAATAVVVASADLPVAVISAAGITSSVVAVLMVRRVVASRSGSEPVAEPPLPEAKQDRRDEPSDQRDEPSDRSAVRELYRALDQVDDEEAALGVIHDAFARHFPGRPVELHLVDAIEPALVVAVAVDRPEDALGHHSSPWEPLVSHTGSTAIYESTSRLDACVHLRSRAGKPSSAAAVPLTATGRILGLIYAFGPDGETPAPGEVALLEDFASVIAPRLAVIRTAPSPTRGDSIDRLTGLPDRTAMQDRVIRLLEDRVPFSVAVADVDHFGELNLEHGRAAGDAALALLGQVSRRATRPDDLVGRVGGDELLFVMPRTKPADAARAIERIREELVLNQSASDSTTRFTLSVGVVGSTGGVTINTILKTAAQALRSAQEAGGNRVVIAEPVTKATARR